MNCPFCQIDPSKILYKTDKFIVFEPLEPQATYHFLICPIEHVKDFVEGAHYLPELIKVAQTLKSKIGSDFYRLTTNVGAPYQTVFHAHMHYKSSNLDCSNQQFIIAQNDCW